MIARTGGPGMARSLWASNTYNVVWDRRQRKLVERTLGSVAGRSVVDIGCGTGRMSRYFADAGAAQVTGLDFSEATLAMARAETSNPNIDYRQADIVNGPLAMGPFDDAVVLGVLAVACSTGDALDKAFANIAGLLKPGGRLLVLEPIHRSRLLRRSLRLGVKEWTASAERAGLSLDRSDRMGFAPFRLVLAVRDLPHAILDPLFDAGEQLLDRAPSLTRLSDYKLLLFPQTLVETEIYRRRETGDREQRRFVCLLAGAQRACEVSQDRSR